MAESSNAERFLETLHANQSDDELKKIQRYFKTAEGDYSKGDVFIGVRMGTVFDLAKAFIHTPIDQIEMLLEREIHEARAGAVKFMAPHAKRKKTTDDKRRALFELYLRRHDRINNWDLLDLGTWGLSVATSPTSRVIYSTNWHDPTTCGSGARPCSAHRTSSVRVIWRMRSSSKMTMVSEQSE